MTKRQQRQVGTFAFRQRLENVEACGQRHRLIDDEAAVALPIGAVHHEASRRLARAAGAKLDVTARGRRLDPKLSQQVVYTGLCEAAIDNDPHRAIVGGVRAHQHYALRERLAGESGGRDQKVAGQMPVGLLVP